MNIFDKRKVHQVHQLIYMSSDTKTEIFGVTNVLRHCAQ